MFTNNKVFKKNKINCHATCLKSDSLSLVLGHFGEHNRQVGSIDDLQYFVLSDTAKTATKIRLWGGYRRRDVCVAIQSNFFEYIKTNMNGDDGNIAHQDRLVNVTESHCIYKKTCTNVEIHKKAPLEIGWNLYLLGKIV